MIDLQGKRRRSDQVNSQQNSPCFSLIPIEMCFSQVKSNLFQTQALVSNPNPIWKIQLTVHDVVSPALLHELYHNLLLASIVPVAFFS
ncbi:hypothetical protein VP01_1073g7 [Puccinia sorghi]|uniref:Uncharacterized protein n=1 Tax=Puccinia sorghi TaxID=27349 RepID=A0A0L6VTK8_9BASI|nr:hypothetical protein VP01_1073g7 [Puccinia sorghi]